MIKVCILGQKPDGTPDFNRRYWLAGDPCKTQADHSGVEGEQRGINRDSQREGGAGWPFKKAVDRAGETLDLQCRTSRKFASAVAAWRWRNSLSSQDPATWPHPVEGDCLMRFELPDGTHEEARLYDCVVKKPTMTAEGETLQLAYTIQGGRIEPHASDLLTVMPLANGYFEDSVQGALYLSVVDYSIDNLPNYIIHLLSGPLTIGQKLVIQFTDSGDLASEVIKSFHVVAEGGAADPGFIALTHPAEDHLSQIVASFAGETNVRCILENSVARPYVYLGWIPAAVGALSLFVRVFNSGGTEIYNHEAIPAYFTETPVLIVPTDADGTIPTAAIPSP